MITKRCGTCKEFKILDLFYNNKRTKDGKGSRCKPCDDEARYQYRCTNIESVRKLERNRHLKHKYGIDLEQYNRMYAEQNGCCAICKSTETRGTHSFSVDHNHVTGEVRGLLCNNCNRALGIFGDSSEILRSAIEYLEKYDIH